MIPMLPDVTLGFTTLEQEVENLPLKIQGQIPNWLTGSLIRNGAAKFSVGNEQYNHWLDGLAMLHKFSFNNGKVSYTNRFLHSNTYNSAMKKGRIVYPEFATTPKKSTPYRIYLNATGKYTDNASVNVSKIGERYIALTETPPRVEFNHHDLNTIGRFKYNDSLIGHLTTVHPHFDYHHNQIINYITRFSLTSTYNVYSIKEGTTKREVMAKVPVKHPSYMHTFGMTKNYVILTQFPLFVDPIRLLRTGSPFSENLFWKPEHGTNFIVVNKITGKIIRGLNAEPFFAFHHVNCYEEDENIVVDIAVYEDSSIFDSLYLSNLRGRNYFLPKPKLKRFYLNIHNGTVESFELTDDFLEFSRINYQRNNTKNYNYIYGLRDHESNGFLYKLSKYHIKDNSFIDWFREFDFPGEPVFVPTPHGDDEDDGIVLSMVLDTVKERTFLLILNASDFQEIARAYLPFAVPFGSHGQYFQ